MKKDIRKEFRESVFKRDENKCVMCYDEHSKLDAHHITDRHEMPNGGYVLSNGITLCDKPNGCHLKAEQFHISDNKETYPGFHPDDLYQLIGSSYVQAFLDSELLENS